MTVEQASTTPAASRSTAGDIVLDGLFAGMIGALLVALWFLVLDLVAGQPLHTPALLGTVLLHGGAAAAQGVTVAPLEVVAYTAFHFLAFIGVGILLSYLMTLFEQFPIVGFVLLVLFVCLEVGFLVLDAALGAQLVGQLRGWTVIVANLLAAAGMAIYLWKRHPGIKPRLDRIWDEKEQ
jgi:hypothetical protein